MKYLLTVAVIIIITALGHYWWVNRASEKSVVGTPIATAFFQCNEGKTINAAFYKGEPGSSSNPDEPPVPGGSVGLVLSDGRTMTLAQTLSASGIRYSDGDPNKEGSESIVFWSKGNGAFILENNTDKTYIGCIKIADDPGGLPQVFESGSEGFSIRYPDGYTVDPAYTYQELGPEKGIAGVWGVT